MQDKQEAAVAETQEAETIPRWGYSKDGAQLFELKKGARLPRGYFDSPAKVPGFKSGSTE